MLSSVELNERIRSLRPGQRLGYSATVALVIVGAFVLAIVLSIILALVFVVIFLGARLTLPDDAIALSLPLVIVFMFAVGMSGLGSQAALIPGQDVRKSALKAARSGLIVGFIAGAIFGFLWALVVIANPLFYAVLMGVALAPALAFFRGIAYVVEPICLRLFAKR
ncbi:MAG: hypothetical protein ABI690_23240 [Chloroflexota bacterium]